jgi:hypothetical protein
MSHLPNDTTGREGKDITASLTDKCDEESCKQPLLLPINKATERAAMHAGKFRSSVLGLRRKEKEKNLTDPAQLLVSPGKKTGKRSWMILTSVSSEIKCRKTKRQQCQSCYHYKKENTFSLGT